MRRWIGIVCITLGIAIGLICAFLPVYDNFVKRQIVANYDQEVLSKPQSHWDEQIAQARKYNEKLFTDQQIGGIAQTDDNTSSYEDLLNLYGDDGMMGYLIIPKIGVDLPIYHSTSDEVLDSGVGHLENTSLPVGGENTLSILTGHRGLPTAKLFTRLDELENGDLFFIRIGSEQNTLAYKVIGREIIDPNDHEAVESLQKIQPGKDIVELMTCHPYGINTQRMFIIGERVDYQPQVLKTEQSKTKILPSITEILFALLPFAIISAFLGRTLWKIRKY